jgi:hypothetical protein
MPGYIELGHLCSSLRNLEPQKADALIEKLMTVELLAPMWDNKRKRDNDESNDLTNIVKRLKSQCLPLACTTFLEIDCSCTFSACRMSFAIPFIMSSGG